MCMQQTHAPGSAWQTAECVTHACCKERCGKYKLVRMVPVGNSYRTGCLSIQTHRKAMSMQHNGRQPERPKSPTERACHMVSHTAALPPH